MPRLEDSEVADEYGPERFMPVEPRDEVHEPSLPKHGTPEWNDFARLANELSRAAPSLLFSERTRVALALLGSDWRRRHDAEVAASARREALEAIAEHLAMPGVLWWGDIGVTVRDPEVEFDRGVSLVDWLLISGGGLVLEPEPVECEHCSGSGNTKVHVKGATVDAPCTPCGGQGVVEAER